MTAQLITKQVKDANGAEISVAFWDDGTGVLRPIHRVEPLALASVSGIIAAGGTAQILRAADPGSRFMSVNNPRWTEGGVPQTESLWINAVGAAAVQYGRDSFELQPGETFTWPDGVTNAVSVLSTVTGQVYVALKG